MSFKLVRSDLVEMRTDAIVNSSSTTLHRNGRFIAEEARSKTLQDGSVSFTSSHVGEAIITDGYNLHAKHLIHTIGPVWRGGGQDEEGLLYSSYKNSLELALANKTASIAFPLISSGIYGYPKHQAFKVATLAIEDFLLENEMDIYLVVNKKDSILLSQTLVDDIEIYIEDNYRDESNIILESYKLQNYLYEDDDYAIDASRTEFKKRRLSDVISNREETFSEMLIRLIDEKEGTDVEAYKKANIDRRLFQR